MVAPLVALGTAVSSLVGLSAIYMAFFNSPPSPTNLPEWHIDACIIHQTLLHSNPHSPPTPLHSLLSLNPHSHPFYPPSLSATPNEANHAYLLTVLHDAYAKAAGPHLEHAADSVKGSLGQRGDKDESLKVVEVLNRVVAFLVDDVSRGGYAAVFVPVLMKKEWWGDEKRVKELGKLCRWKDGVV